MRATALMDETAVRRNTSLTFPPDISFSMENNVELALRVNIRKLMPLVEYSMIISKVYGQYKRS